MCHPLIFAGASAVLGIGEAVAGYQGQRAAYEANREAANINFANQSNVIEQRRVQLDMEASESAFDTAIAQAQEAGRISASAADTGLGGSSLIQSINAGMFGVGRQATAENINTQSMRNQLGTELQGAQIARQSQINQVARPTRGSLLLGIGKGVLSGANTYMGLGGRLPGGAS